MRWRTAGKIFAWLALASAVVGAYRSDRFMIKRPEANCEKYQRNIARHLAERQDVFLYMPMDEPRPLEWISGRRVVQVGTRSVPGRYGRARAFGGTETDALRLPVSWKSLGPAFTISTWISPDPSIPIQCILGDAIGHPRNGLRYRDGEVIFSLPTFKGPLEVSCPVPPSPAWTHIAAVADSQRGKISIFKNGRLCAEKDFHEYAPNPVAIEIGRNHHIAPVIFYKGRIDELIAFRRPLKPDEIAALATTDVPRWRAWGGSSSWKWQVALRWRDALKFILRSVDYFNPSIHASNLPRNLPEVRLSLSGADVIHFARAEMRGRENGFLDGDAAERRHVVAKLDERVGPAFLSAAQAEGAEARLPLHLEFSDGYSCWLLPPERYHFLRPVFASERAAHRGRPGPTFRPCILLINHRFRGIYLLREGEQRGEIPVDLGSVPDETGADADALRIYEEVVRRDAVALLNDTASPVSRREIQRGLKRELESWRNAVPPTNAPAQPSIYFFLGRNESPFFITNNLDLAVEDAGGWHAQWRTDHPAVIDDTGHVHRPAGAAPVDVRLEGQFERGVETWSETFRFRVMPEQPQLSAVMLDVSQPVSSFSRVLFSARYLDANATNEPLPHFGAIKLRGKAARFADKKSYSLHMEQPPGWVAGSPSRYVYLMSFYRDRTFIKDRLAFDLWRSFATSNAPRYAPRTQPVELFINGAYQGIYGMSERIDRDLFGWPAYEPGRVQPLVYYIQGEPASFRQWSNGRGYVQREPPPDQSGTDLWPLHKFVNFVARAPQKKFAAEIASYLDLTNAADYYILLNAMNNRDGEEWNYYLMRDAAPGSRWMFVPWDYDRTLAPNLDLRSNYLFRRLKKYVPAFRVALHERWNVLRGTVLSEPELDRRFAELTPALSAYAKWEYEKWPGGKERYEDDVAEAREAMRERLVWMDAHVEAVSKGP